jgi:cation transport ATPase
LTKINSLNGTLSEELENLLLKYASEEPSISETYFDILDKEEIFPEIITLLNARLSEIQKQIAREKAAQDEYDKKKKQEEQEKRLKEQQKQKEMRNKTIVAAINLPITVLFFFLIFVFKSIPILLGTVILYAILLLINAIVNHKNIISIFVAPLVGGLIGFVAGIVGWLLSSLWTFITVVWVIATIFALCLVIFSDDITDYN